MYVKKLKMTVVLILCFNIILADNFLNKKVDVPTFPNNITNTIFYNKSPGTLFDAKRLLIHAIYRSGNDDNSIPSDQIDGIIKNLNMALSTVMYYKLKSTDKKIKQDLENLYNKAYASIEKWGKQLGVWTMINGLATSNKNRKCSAMLCAVKDTAKDTVIPDTDQLAIQKIQRELVETSGYLNKPGLASLALENISLAIESKVPIQEISDVLTDEDITALEHYIKTNDGATMAAMKYIRLVSNKKDANNTGTNKELKDLENNMQHPTKDNSLDAKYSNIIKQIRFVRLKQISNKNKN